MYLFGVAWGNNHLFRLHNDNVLLLGGNHVVALQYSIILLYYYIIMDIIVVGVMIPLRQHRWYWRCEIKWIIRKLGLTVRLFTVAWMLLNLWGSVSRRVVQWPRGWRFKSRSRQVCCCVLGHSLGWAAPSRQQPPLVNGWMRCHCEAMLLLYEVSFAAAEMEVHDSAKKCWGSHPSKLQGGAAEPRPAFACSSDWLLLTMNRWNLHVVPSATSVCTTHILGREGGRSHEQTRRTSPQRSGEWCSTAEAGASSLPASRHGNWLSKENRNGWS